MLGHVLKSAKNYNLNTLDFNFLIFVSVETLTEDMENFRKTSAPVNARVNEIRFVEVTGVIRFTRQVSFRPYVRIWHPITLPEHGTHWALM